MTTFIKLLPFITTSRDLNERELKKKSVNLAVNNGWRISQSPSILQKKITFLMNFSHSLMARCHTHYIIVFPLPNNLTHVSIHWNMSRYYDSIVFPSVFPIELAQSWRNSTLNEKSSHRFEIVMWLSLFLLTIITNFTIILFVFMISFCSTFHWKS